MFKASENAIIGEEVVSLDRLDRLGIGGLTYSIRLRLLIFALEGRIFPDHEQRACLAEDQRPNLRGPSQ